MNFIKTLNINNKSYSLKLDLEPSTSILRFEVIDLTDPKNP